MSAALSQLADDQAALRDALPVAGWAHELRQQALERFQASGFPTTRLENWKYTNVRAIERGRFVPWTARPHGLVEADTINALAVPGFDAYRAVFVDGQFLPALSELPDEPGIECTSLRDMLSVEPPASADLVAWLASQEDGFATLNTAFLGDGMCIRAHAGTRLEKPLCLLFIATRSDPPRAIHPRVLIDAGKQSQLSVVEHFTGLDGAAGLTNVVTQIRLQAGAQLDHCRLQEESNRGYHVGSICADLMRDSRLASHNLQTGARLSRADIHARLAGRGAHVLLNGFYLAGGRQHTDSHTLVDHLVPDTTSDEEYRGVLTGHGRAVFNGLAVVHAGAIRTNAQQANHNLLLSDGAEIDTKPELEIYTDDVKCSHGATVGALDEDALFYLRSRGIEQSTARAILTFAFADEVLRRVGDEALRNHVERRVLSMLPQNETIREFL